MLSLHDITNGEHEGTQRVQQGALVRCGHAGAGGSVRAQQPVAAAVTDPNDPTFLTEQTRKQGGPMPAEQMALVFDHLDHALKVFPADKRIEGVTTLSFTTKAPIRTVILDSIPSTRSPRSPWQGGPAIQVFQS